MLRPYSVEPESMMKLTADNPQKKNLTRMLVLGTSFFIGIMMMLMLEENSEPTDKSSLYHRHLSFFDPTSIDAKDVQRVPESGAGVDALIKDSSPSENTMTSMSSSSTMENSGTTMSSFGSENSATTETTGSSSAFGTTEGNTMEETTSTISSTPQENAIGATASQPESVSMQQKSSVSPDGPTVIHAKINDPSYETLCHAVVDRSENHYDVYTPYIVIEAPEVCETQESYGALGTIMMSAMIAQAASRERVFYQHQCWGVRENENINNTITSIQSWLPQDLSFAIGLGIEPIAQQCTYCLEQMKRQGRILLECLGFPNPGYRRPENPDPMMHSFRMAGFRHNVEKAVQTYKLAERSKRDEVVSRTRQLRSLQVDSSLAEGVSNPNPTPAEEVSNPAPVDAVSNPSPTYGGAVIVLDVQYEVVKKDRSFMVPMYWYHTMLSNPNLTKGIIDNNTGKPTSIAVLVMERCAIVNPLCQTHGQELAKSLKERFPDTQIFGEVVQSTAELYDRIMQAPLLLCPSPTMSCILPSIWRDYNTISVIMYSRELYKWYKYTASENEKLMHKKIQLFDPIGDRKFKLQGLSPFHKEDEISEKTKAAIRDFLNQKKK